MLLGLYVGSTLYVWFDAIRLHLYIKKRLKEEGYKNTTKGFYLGDIFIIGVYLAFLSIPLLNLISPIVNHNRERSYDEQKNYLEEAGSIEKIDEEEKPMVRPYDNQVKKINKVVYVSKSSNIEELDNENEKGFQKVYKRK